MRKDLVICTTARSGSNLLCDYLSNTALVGRAAEFFNPDIVTGGWEGKRYAFAEAVSMSAYIEHLRAEHGTSSGRICVKMLHEDFEFLATLPAVLDFFRNADVVFLRRRSKLAQAVSYFLAEQTGRWVHSDAGRCEPGDVTYDFARLDRWLKMLSQQENEWLVHFRCFDKAYLEIVFEDFVHDVESGLRRIFHFIGIERAIFPVYTKIRQQKTQISEMMIERYLRDRAAKLGSSSSASYKNVAFTD